MKGNRNSIAFHFVWDEVTQMEWLIIYITAKENQRICWQNHQLLRFTGIIL